MRLFVGAWPPTDVRVALADVGQGGRPLDGVRWVPADQYHVTLRFLGSMDSASSVIDALAAAALPVATAIGGPLVERLGQQVAAVPIEGLDELAGAVAAATAGLGEPAADRPLRAHLTLARSKHGDFGELIGRAVSVSWPVTSIRVVRSGLQPTGARYETVRVIDLPTRGA